MRTSLRVLAAISVLVASVLIGTIEIQAQQAPGAAPPATTGGGTPRIEIAEPKHDFGKVWVGDKLEHTFKIRNAGDGELKILAVKPWCACAVPVSYPDSIAAGDTGDLRVRLNADRRRGDYSTTIRIDTNDPVNKNVNLGLSVHMQQFLDAKPHFVFFDKLKPDSSAQETVVLTSKTDKPLKLSTKGVLPSRVFTWDLKEISPGKTYELLVSAKPPYPGKRNAQTIEIDLGIPDIPPVRIACTAIVRERLDVDPKLLLIPMDNQPRFRSITFLNTGDKAVRLLEAVSTDPNIKVNLVTVKPGWDYRVNLSFPAGYVTSAPETFITLKTDDAEQPEIRVFVRSPATAARPTPPRPGDSVDGGQQTPKTEAPEEQPATQLVGIPAPVVNAATFDGQPVQIGGPSVRVRVLAFYTSWSGPSRQALAGVEALHKKYGGKGVEILVINLDARTGQLARTEEQTLAHYKELNLSVPMIMDPYQLIGPKFRVKTHPTFVLIGKSGTVEAVHFEPNTPVGATLPTQIDLLLQGKTRADFPAVAKTPPPTTTRPTTTQPVARPRPVMELVGNPAPAASVKTIDGKEIRIGAGSDRIQLLTFYASWCGYCRRAMPIVEQLHKDYQSKGVEIIAINGDARSGPRAKTEEQSLATYKEWNLSMPVTMDPNQKLQERYKVRGVPTFVLVGRNGTVEAAHPGLAPTFDSTVRTELNLLLEGKTREAFPQAPARPAAARPETQSPTQLSGKPAPSVSAKTLDGSDIKIGAGAGKVQLLAFYASWCGVCKRVMPAFEQLHHEFKDKGVEFIAVNEDVRSGGRARTEAQSLETYKQWNLSMPATMDPEQKIGQQYMVGGYPTFFVVGTDGKVEAVYVGGGAVLGDTARSRLDSLLKNKPSAGASGAGGN